MTVDVEGLSRRFGAATALDGVSLRLGAGEFAALLGPSGSGKTTLLRILAGLDAPDAGRVRIAGRDMAGVPARARGVGVVFQSYALFRHMSVADNVAFGLRVRPHARRPSRAETARKVRDLLELVGIPELAARHPDQLSGGQRQRVALARALAIEPPLLLLDEPFAALDALVRRDVRRWVRGLHDRLGITTLLVTHDQDEAMEMADRIAVMDGGRIVQFASARELLEDPTDAFVAGFVGHACRLPARVSGGRLQVPGLGELGPVALPDGAASLCVRAEEAEARPASRATGVRVVRSWLAAGGTQHRVSLDVQGHGLDAVAAGPMPAGSAAEVTLRRIRVFPHAGNVPPMHAPARPRELAS